MTFTKKDTYFKCARFIKRQCMEHIFVDSNVGLCQAGAENLGGRKAVVLTGAIDSCLPHGVNITTSSFPNRFHVHKGFGNLGAR